MLQQDNLQQQIAVLVRTYFSENKPLSKEAIVSYLHEILGIDTVTEEDVEKALLGIFARDEMPVTLRQLPLTQAFLFSKIVYGSYDSDYSFVVVRGWAAKTLCYATYAVTRDPLIAPKLILICTKEKTILDQLKAYQMCPPEWLPLSVERGCQIIQKTLEDVQGLLADKVADLREAGPLCVGVAD